ncbi:hypothetical protein [Pseudomonas putida]|uniref:Uncharacterized protein n=1 Tax=Pseudomonas putida TaxID=303 RepID=A0A2C5VM37_PSEPU|nr:hypothetical protein [Pseudomonas putida]PHH39798.1 hypothetical protein CRX57_06315 [Pseudomonas putida]
MSFSSSLRFIKHNIAVFLIVGGIFAGTAGAVGAWLWSEYRDLLQQKAQFEQRRFELAEVQHERERNLTEIMNKRELDLKNREYIAGQVESSYAERESVLKARELELQRTAQQLNQDQQALIAEHGEKAAEMKLQALMSEFSAMGVNLNVKPRCGKDQEKFYSAKSKYDEIYSWAEAHSLEKKYQNFLFHNQQSVITFGCVKNEAGASAP